MPKFTSKFSDSAWELERALSSIRSPDSVLFHYAAKDCSWVKTPVYALPVELINGDLIAYFFQGEPFQAKIGFKIKKDIFAEEDFFACSYEGIVQIDKPRDDVLYLPLRTTFIKERPGNINKKDLSDLVKVYSLGGKTEENPLLLVSRIEKGLRGLGLYKTEFGIPALYSKKISRTKYAKVNNVVRLCKGGKMNFKSPYFKRKLRATTKLKQKQKQVLQDSKTGIIWENPKSIVDYLDKFVVSQNNAKRSVAIAFSNFMTYLKNGLPYEDKDNMLIIGPTGSGKTFMIDLLVSAANIPKAEAKLVGKSSTGFVGENLSSVFDQIYNVIEDGNESPYGLVFLDEIDKLAKGASIGSFDSSLQNELVGWLEDAVIQPTSEKRSGSGIMRTRNLLFVFAGAFQNLSEGLDDIIKERIGLKSSIGFGAPHIDDLKKTNLASQVLPEDLVKYGLMRELVGRISTFAVTKDLSVEEKVKILTISKKSPLIKYNRLLKLRGFDLKMSANSYFALVDRCPKETGARALKQICSNLFEPILFEPEKFAENKTIRITEDLVPSLLTLYQNLNDK